MLHDVGNSSKEPLKLPIFTDELADILAVTYRSYVKDLDDQMLEAMGCSPREDEAEKRYGLLTGVKIELEDLNFFQRYLLEKGE